MAYSPAQNSEVQFYRERVPRPGPNMSVLAMPAPPSYPPFKQDLSWNPVGRPSAEPSFSQENQKPVALPSIRQTFPDLHLESSLADVAANRIPGEKQPPPAHHRQFPSPEYVHSPAVGKRRRISNEDEQESLRAKQVPRLYRSPDQPHSRDLSPGFRSGRAPPANTDSQANATYWTENSNRPAAYSPIRSAVPPPPGDMAGRHSSRAGLHPMPRPQATEQDHYAAPQRGPSTVSNPPAPPRDGPGPGYHGQDYGYSYQQPPRLQTVATGTMRPYERAPYSAGASYGAHYQESGRYGDLSTIGLGTDAKQRKRRGNLPKETTDKLRTWFVAHLQHPYPTEDEKQELMRQTGLQMNQISNWFINARRRQLPAMINNARVESEAMHSRAGQSHGGENVLPSTERPQDYGVALKHDGGHMSDEEGASYDDDMLRHRRPDMNRESV